MRNIFLTILLSLSLCGCAKMTGMKVGGDDQLMKLENKAENQNIELAGIKKLVADLKATVGVQAGLVNKTLNDNRETNAGRDSVMNDPAMIEKLALYGVVAVVSPFVLIILGFVTLLVMMNWSSQKRHKEQMAMLKNLVGNISDSLDKMIALYGQKDN